MSRREQEEMFQKFTKSTHFDFEEIVMLKELFDLLKTKTETIDRTGFRDLLHTSFHMSDNDMMDRIVLGWPSEQDGGESTRNFSEFVAGMSRFLRGTLDEKIDFAFNVYDCLKRDRFISREEMHQLLSHTIVDSPSEEDKEETVRDLIELLMKKMDLDKDHRIGAEDFTKSVQGDKLLLQVFGPCLPQKAHADKFLTEATLNVYRAKYAR
eukprot:m.52361 g.52361  ORF g.52361 m.52361 type:complete len:210 (-) comp21590_c0_seq1:212-841(-)